MGSVNKSFENFSFPHNLLFAVNKLLGDGIYFCLLVSSLSSLFLYFTANKKQRSQKYRKQESQQRDLNNRCWLTY